VRARTEAVCSWSMRKGMDSGIRTMMVSNVFHLHGHAYDDTGTEQPSWHFLDAKRSQSVGDRNASTLPRKVRLPDLGRCVLMKATITVRRRSSAAGATNWDYGYSYMRLK